MAIGNLIFFGVLLISLFCTSLTNGSKCSLKEDIVQCACNGSETKITEVFKEDLKHFPNTKGIRFIDCNIDVTKSIYDLSIHKSVQFYQEKCVCKALNMRQPSKSSKVRLEILVIKIVNTSYHEFCFVNLGTKNY